MAKYQYILFDLDGTLTDSAPGITRCVKYALEQSGIKETDFEKLRRFLGPPMENSFREFYGFSEEDAAKAAALYRSQYNDGGIFENSVFPGIPQMLEKLHLGGKKLALASSKPQYMVERVLGHFDLTEFFDVIVGAGEWGSLKPVIVAKALEDIGVTEEALEHVIMVGDRFYDVEGAKACGVDSLGTYLGYAEVGELEKAGATYIAQNADEMYEILKQ